MDGCGPGRSSSSREGEGGAGEGGAGEGGAGERAGSGCCGGGTSECHARYQCGAVRGGSRAPGDGCLGLGRLLKMTRRKPSASSSSGSGAAAGRDGGGGRAKLTRRADPDGADGVRRELKSLTERTDCRVEGGRGGGGDGRGGAEAAEAEEAAAAAEERAARAEEGRAKAEAAAAGAAHPAGPHHVLTAVQQSARPRTENAHWPPPLRRMPRRPSAHRVGSGAGGGGGRQAQIGVLTASPIARGCGGCLPSVERCAAGGHDGGAQRVCGASGEFRGRG